MIAVSGYQTTERLYESHQTFVYRGIREKDEKPVVLKILKEEYPPPESLAKFRREFEMTRAFNLNGVIKVYGLEKYQNTLVMILEDFGGESLKTLLPDRSLDLAEFLRLAIRMTDNLGQIHQQNIIHKDINPSNIVWNPKIDQVKIIDFGISTELSREVTAILNPDALEGTLSYMSPEQTGRMNRAMDYRTDFYSLGVTFYHCLTGQLPFQASDPMELVHCHMAKMPIPPHRINPEYPKILSAIISKLMAKNAEDRYQSSARLSADLKACLDQLVSKEHIDDFEIGQNDISNRFQIPQKLYGREKEIETLILERRGYFISGKFDQFQKDVPYASLIQAFRELVRQLLSESEERIDFWKRRLLSSLGPNGQIIIDVIPEIELILGKQPDVPDLAPQESRNRFESTFQNFMSALSGIILLKCQNQ